MPPPTPRRPLDARLLQFLTENQCTTCLGWSAGARRLAERFVGRRARIRPCVCHGAKAAPAGQGELEVGGVA